MKRVSLKLWGGEYRIGSTVGKLMAGTPTQEQIDAAIRTITLHMIRELIRLNWRKL